MAIYQNAEHFIDSIFWQELKDKSELDLIGLIESKLIADNKVKDPEYFGHREGVVHASSIYGCLRGVVHEMIGTKRDEPESPRQLGVFKAGNLFEEFVIEALGDKVIERQTQYEYKYKSITLVGRSDYKIDDNGVIRVGENKSVHSDSFWYREKEGKIVAWHNIVQLQIYMWLERELYKRELDGVFTYISKDDCTIVSCPIKYSPKIISECVLPALEIINHAYEQKDPNLCPVPDMTAFSESRNQYQKNWLATYCPYHSSCAGIGWVLEAAKEVTKRNKEMKEGMGPMPHMEKKEKPVITVVKDQKLEKAYTPDDYNNDDKK